MLQSLLRCDARLMPVVAIVFKMSIFPVFCLQIVLRLIMRAICRCVKMLGALGYILEIYYLCGVKS